MKSSFDILSTMKQKLDPILDDVITGKVLLRQSERNDQLENVVLGILNNPGTYVQEGFMNVNPECVGLSEEKPNMERLKTIVDLILPELDDKVITVGTTTLHVTVDGDNGIFKDQDKGNKFFYNIRVNFVTL